MPRLTAMDRRIIDCLIADDPEELTALAEETGGETVIQDRAKELGLTNDMIKTCRLNGSRPKQRTCMKCDKSFLSWGIRNRLCARCTPR